MVKYQNKISSDQLLVEVFIDVALNVKLEGYLDAFTRKEGQTVQVHVLHVAHKRIEHDPKVVQEASSNLKNAESRG